MRLLEIKHPELEPYELYLCSFNSNQDVINFATNHPWFLTCGLQISPPESTIILRCKKDGEEYAEKLHPVWLKNDLRRKSEVMNAIVNEVYNFFK